MNWIDEQLNAIDRAGLRRELRPVTPLSPVEACFDGRRVVLFSTNDYLGLSGHSRVIARAAELTRQHGMGPRSAALLAGHTVLHEQLQTALAQLKGTEAALLFPTGYMANVGILQALGGDDAAIFSDELNHASLIDGCRLSRSAIHVYRHADVDHLQTLMGASRAGRKIIVTDALFSMEGDAAPLPEIVALKERHECLLILDEAHSTLVFGKTGAGLAEHCGVHDRVDIHMGTLSKALGALGGYAATSRKMRDVLMHRARSFIFTTALPIPVVAAALAALEAFHSEPQLRRALGENIAFFTQLLDETRWRQTRREPASPIFPLIVGEATTTMTLSAKLFQRGFHVPAIRPPTVPPGTARLRVSLSAAHSEAQLTQLASALTNALSD